MNRRALLAGTPSSAFAALLPACATQAIAPRAPVAARIPTRIEQLGRVRVDEYAWLKDPNWLAVWHDPRRLSANFRSHLEAENTYAALVLADAEADRRALLAEMTSRAGVEVDAPPVADGGWAYAQRHAVGASHPEGAARYQALREAVVANGHDLMEAPDHGVDPIAAVHDAGYLRLLQSAWSRRAELDPDAEELLTTQFARTQMHRRSEGLINQLGYHTADTSTPIRADTWTAIYGSAQAAIAAADAALTSSVAYALCRPPGHHAYADCAGGFCYLNNTAIAAQRLRDRTGQPVAVLDIDVHHGNGTQGVFYARGDVLTISIHAETSNYFPLFAGYADEVGEGEGAGCNLNLPLAHGAGDGEVLAALEVALRRLVDFSPTTIVVALGLDAADEDPLGVFNVTNTGFAEIARRIARLGLPTALVQEGGYLCPALPRNLSAFLAAFEQERAP